MRIVFCTSPVEEADKISRTLVEEKLVACVNIIPAIQSFYSWEGEICVDKESLMIMKTRKELIPILTERINQIHSYDVVEVIAMEIKEGDSAYLKWIKLVTQ